MSENNLFETTKRGGYDVAQVDSYIQRMQQQRENLQKELEIALNASAVQEPGEPRLYDPDGAAGRILAAAQTAADKMLVDARREAEEQVAAYHERQRAEISEQAALYEKEKAELANRISAVRTLKADIQKEIEDLVSNTSAKVETINSSSRELGEILASASQIDSTQPDLEPAAGSAAFTPAPAGAAAGNGTQAASLPQTEEHQPESSELGESGELGVETETETEIETSTGEIETSEAPTPEIHLESQLENHAEGQIHNAAQEVMNSDSIFERGASPRLESGAPTHLVSGEPTHTFDPLVGSGNDSAREETGGEEHAAHLGGGEPTGVSMGGVTPPPAPDQPQPVFGLRTIPKPPKRKRKDKSADRFLG